MIEHCVRIFLNRKDDYENIKSILLKLKIQAPVLFVELENSIQISFTADYFYNEMNYAIIDLFPEYEFTQDLGNGRKEIRIQIERWQNPYSNDGWGSRIEDPVDEKFFLVKKSKKEGVKFNPKVRVLFEDEEKEYFINIVGGIIKSTDEKGFIVLKGFDKYEDEENIKRDFLSKTLFKEPIEAFWTGFRNLEEFVSTEFEEYIKQKRKKTKKKK